MVIHGQVNLPIKLLNYQTHHIMLELIMLQMIKMSSAELLSLGSAGRDKMEKEFDERLILNKYLEFFSHYFFKSTVSGNMLLLSYVSGCFQALTIYVEEILTGQGRSKAFSVIILSKFLIGASISIFLILNTSMTWMARINGILISNIICFIIRCHIIIQPHSIPRNTNALPNSPNIFASLSIA